MNHEVQNLIDKIIGQPCKRREVGSYRSLILGFGDLAKPEINQKRDHRLWELGIYFGDWKITQGDSLLLVKDRSKSIGELDNQLESLRLGNFVRLTQTSQSTVQVELDDDVIVEFIGDTTEDDEYFHVFCPGDLYIEFSKDGWRVGPSDVPWPPS